MHVLCACFVLWITREKTVMKSHKTIKKTHPPAASQIQKIVFYWRFRSPESHSTSTPTQEPRWARPKTYHQDKQNKRCERGKCRRSDVNFMLPEAFPGQDQIIFLLNENIVSQLTLFYAIISPPLLHPPPPPPPHYTDSHTCVLGVKGSRLANSFCVLLNYSMSTGFQCETLHLWTRLIICLNG